MDEPGSVLFFTAIRVALAGVVSIGLFRLITVKGLAFKPLHYGRKWTAWTVSTVSMTALPKFFRYLDADSFVRWAAVTIPLGILAFIAGLIYGIIAEPKKEQEEQARHEMKMSGLLTVRFVPHGTINYPPKDRSYTVPIISTHGPQLSEDCYITLGNIEAAKDAIAVFDEVNLNDEFAMIKQAARENGADALIKVAYWHGPVTSHGIDSIRIIATAIVFKNSEEAFRQLKGIGAVFW